MSRCPDCGGFETSTGIEGVSCRNCGLVLDDSPLEQNPYVSETVKKYASLPGLETAFTKPMNGRIIKHHWLLSTKQKNLYKAKKKLERISSRLRLPKTVETETYSLFKTAVDRGLNVGRDNNTMLYASVYTACIMHRIPKTALEITAFTEIDKNKMLNAHKILKNKLKLELEPIDLTDYVHRFSSRLDLKPTTASVAVEILEQLKGKTAIVGKNPKTIVATAIYLATKINNDPKTQREITNATGVIEVTIRKRSKEMMQEIELIF